MLPDYLLTIIRTVIAFFTLLILARILGKKQIAQLTFFEYVTGITIGSIAASLCTDLKTRPLVLYVGIVTWTSLTFILEMVALKNRKLAKITDGEPVVLIQNGKIMEDRLAVARYRFDDLMSQLRKKGIFSPTDVEFAVLETDGTISVLPKSQLQPVTPKDLKIPTAYKGLSVELIQEGEILENNLKQVKLDRDWLLNQLKIRNIELHNVAYASLDTQGKLYVDLYDDKGITVIDPSDYEGPN